jgi:hypothetical protein
LSYNLFLEPDIQKQEIKATFPSNFNYRKVQVPQLSVQEIYKLRISLAKK